jgi:hypothetical protein
MMLSGQALAMTLGQWIVLTGGGLVAGRGNRPRSL